MLLFSLDKYPLMELLDYMVVLGLYAGEDKRQEEKGMTEDEMVGWHHQLDGHQFEQAQLMMNREGCHAAVHGVTKSLKQVSD